MDKEEFQRALEKYPKVRDKEYKAPDPVEPGSVAGAAEEQQLQPQADVRPPDAAASSVAQDYPDERAASGDTGTGREQLESSKKSSTFSFWERLEEVVAEKLSKEDTPKFCRRFRAAHKELVERRLSLDAIERIVEHWGVGQPGSARKSSDDQTDRPP